MTVQVMVNFLYSIISLIFLIYISIRVYSRDSFSRVNRFFTYATSFGTVAFMIYPFGWLFWNYGAIFITMRLFYIFLYAGIIMICWCSRIIVEGDALWDQRKNIVVFVSLFIIIVLGTLSPDAILLDLDPPEEGFIRTREGPWLASTIYSVGAVAFISTILSFIQAYQDFKNEDPVITYQIRMFIYGVFGFSMSMTSALFFSIIGYRVPLILPYGGGVLGLFIMSLGFRKDSSLVKIKIVSELRQMNVRLRKGRINQVQAQIGKIKELVRFEGSSNFLTRLLILESQIMMFLYEYENGRIALLEEALSIAQKNQNSELIGEVRMNVRHLDVHSRAFEISSSMRVEAPEDQQNDLEKALSYLDMLISLRQSKDSEWVLNEIETSS